MLHRISVIVLLMVVCAYSYQIDYKLFKLEVLPIYPAKTTLYEKEPVFIRFDLSIKENKTGLKREILLKSLKLKPEGKNVILASQERGIHPDEKKLVVKNVVYYKKGKSQFTFRLWFETEKLKNLLSEELISLMSEKILLEKKQPVYISKIPYDTPYVGSFNIKTYLKGEKGIATLTVKIDGKGFPHLPNYRLIVKNGTAKKVQLSIKHKMGYVESVQKFKISYMEEVEVLPVTFRFFDPYQEKLREIKTKMLRILPAEKKIKKQVKPLSEEEKIKLKIEKFKRLHPELFEETFFYEKMLTAAFIYRHYVIGFITLTLLITVAVLKRVLQTYVSPSVREVIALKLNSIEDFKKLYRFFPEKKIGSYLNRVEKLLFKSEIKDMKGRVLYIKSEGKLYTPQKIFRMFEEMKWEIIKEKIEDLPKRKRVITKLYYLLNRHSDLIFSLILLLLITGFIQFFTEKFPQHRQILTFINITTVVVFLLYITIISRKVRYVRTAK